jgi:hypothetical protein
MRLGATAQDVEVGRLEYEHTQKMRALDIQRIRAQETLALQKNRSEFCGGCDCSGQGDNDYHRWIKLLEKYETLPDNVEKD